ncbi:MAG: tripartite tricarboxylate transporter TctB family protein [Castellaniella sp.]|uniref:tripartite tricarboxylate transporter TctB family protein n=1 Tax=Castellaniella sp. TaxID=1955812 RepID=UPI003C7078E1
MHGKEDTIAGIVFILMGVAFLIMAWPFPAGTQDGVPGPGYFPIALSLLLIVLSLIMIVNGIVRKTSFNFFDTLFKANLGVLLLTNLALIAYLVLWGLVPFVLNTGVFLIVLGMIFRRKFVTNAIFSILTTAIIYLLFGQVFHIML